jgi:hypothetical protein
MNGLIRNAGVLLACALALAGTAGCTTTCCGWGGDGATCAGGDGACGGKCGGCKCGGHGDCDWDVYDKCYPERYWWQSRQEVNRALAPQVHNGHVLDQTVWASHFECGTDKLTCAGQDHLAYLVRRRPCPDTTIYLQTADDVPYDCACPDQVAAARQKLDCDRVQAIQKYLVSYTAGRPVDFQVLIHDPSDPGQSAIGVGNSVLLMYARYRGGVGVAGGGAAAAAAGATGGR